MSEPQPKNGNGRDPRIDKIVTWASTGLVTLAFFFLSYEFSALKSAIDSVSAKIDNVGMRLTTMEARLPALESVILQVKAEQIASTPKIYSIDVLAKEVQGLGDELRRLRDEKKN